MLGRPVLLALFLGPLVASGCGSGSNADVLAGVDASPVADVPPGADPASDSVGDGGTWPAVCLGFEEPSGPSCNGVGTAGCCDADGRVVWCQEGRLYCHDCRRNPEGERACGWRAAGGSAGYDCGGTGSDPTGIFPRECREPCRPDCGGRECGSDGCGGYCGTCENDRACENGRCVDPGAAYPEVCRGFQEPSGGACPEDLGTYGCCDDLGRVVWCDRGRLYCNDCSRNPAPRSSCGWFQQEGFQGYDCGGDGEDPSGAAKRACGESCEPRCGTSRCGPDGCGALCGRCETDQVCLAGICTAAPGGVVTGSLRYEVLLPDYLEHGGVALGETVVRNADHVPVAVVDAAGEVVGQAEVREDGSFRIPLARSLRGGENLVVTAGYEPAGRLLIAVLKPDPVVEPASLTSPMWAWSRPLSGLAAGETTITVAQGSGALHVYRMAVLGMDQVLQHLAKTTWGLPGLALLWAPDAPWSVGLAFGKVSQKIEGGPYLPQSIFVGGGAGTSGPWGEAVILHEFGHYIQNNFTRNDSPGGSHYVGELISPPFAWAEAFSNFFGISTQSLLSGRPDGRLWLIVDYGKGSRSSWWIDFPGGIGPAGGFTPPVFANGMTQFLDEMYLTGMLWDLWDGVEFADDDEDGTALGTSRFLRALVSDRFLDVDRGAVGVDFVDFVDAVLCAEPDLRAMVSGTLRDVLKFPYDGSPFCPSSRAPSGGPRIPQAPRSGPAPTPHGLQPPLEVQVSGAAEGEDLVLSAKVTITVPGALPVLRVLLPAGARLVEGRAIEELPASTAWTSTRREFRIRGTRGPVTVSLSARGPFGSARSEAAWFPKALPRSGSPCAMRPMRPVLLGEVRVGRTIPLTSSTHEELP